MKKTIVLMLLAAWILPAMAQNNLSTPSIDPQSDAMAIAKMRHKMDSIRKYRPTVAVVLAGGGAKGAAHIGALEYLQELGIPIDMVLGTSMGGLMGGLVAMGYPPTLIDSILVHTDWGTMLSDKVPSGMVSYHRRKFNERYMIRIPLHYENDEWEQRRQDEIRATMQSQQNQAVTSSQTGEQVKQNAIANLPEGYLYGYNVNNIINSLTAGYQDSMDFCDLPVPYCCVATDLVSMKAKYWTHGKLVDAMRSTMSIPLYFTPVRRDGMVLVDGGTRNNFPTDMARAMGADYVIGVDLSQPRTYSEINGATTLLLQCIALMGKDAFDRNLPLADVYIHPDMTGMNMLSFDSNSIATCLHRGYVSAQGQHEKLKAIRDALGTNVKYALNNKEGINIAARKVVIGDVRYEGIDERMTDFFRRHSNLEMGKAYGSADIEQVLADMYGSSYFDQVSYSLEGTQEPFTLVFHCKRGPIHQFGFGLRGDLESAISASLYFGFNRRKVYGFKFDVEAVLGINPSARLDVKYAIYRGPVIGVEGYTRVQTLTSLISEKVLPNYRDQNLYWYNHARFYIAPNMWKNGGIKGGYQIEAIPYFRSFYSCDDEARVKGNEYYADYSQYYEYRGDAGAYSHSIFVEGYYNNTDDGYFPSKGWCFDVRYNAYFNSKEFGLPGLFDPMKYQILYGNVKGVIPVANRFAIIPSGYFYTAQKYKNPFSGEQTPTLLFHANYLGGMMADQYTPYQMPYIGYNKPNMNYFANSIIMANVDFRFQINPKHFLTFVTAGYGTVIPTDIKDALTSSGEEYNIKTYDYAFALQYGYKSAIGPITCDVHWSKHSMPSHWGVRLKVGFDF